MAKLLPFVMQDTDLHHNLWCWAAVAASVATFKRKTPHQQCAVASQVIIGQDCCGNGNCNRPALLEDALGAVGHLLFNQAFPTDAGRIRDEIDANNPVCVRVGWDDLAIGHFFAIVGYHNEGDLVVVADPQYGPSPAISLESIRTSYQGAGRWTDTYFVS
jgi:hypothetical protein